MGHFLWPSFAWQPSFPRGSILHFVNKSETADNALDPSRRDSVFPLHMAFQIQYIRCKSDEEIVKSDLGLELRNGAEPEIIIAEFVFYCLRLAIRNI